MGNTRGERRRAPFKGCWQQDAGPADETGVGRGTVLSSLTCPPLPPGSQAKAKKQSLAYDRRILQAAVLLFGFHWKDCIVDISSVKTSLRILVKHLPCVCH